MSIDRAGSPSLSRALGDVLGEGLDRTLAFGSGHSSWKSGDMPAGLDQLQVRSQILKDGPCSDYCML